ncbi:hypothetical protein [Agrobacterium vitis]|uniref:hypothetical protein n=1 Tax=Agrobacterium vitis TaxID=373 RepID=UPI0012E7B791|nr:hypothetical protein [Agrobacterium vitis]MUZ65303.1 hypothetical protein [Agrobacterium vitis]
MSITEDRSNWEYLPDGWADEIQPEYRADINAFVHKNDDATFSLRPPKDSEFHDSGWHTRPLAHGQVVQFLASEAFENYELTVFKDGFETSPRNTLIANLFQIWSGPGDHEFNEDDGFNSIEDLVDAAGLDGSSLETQRLQPATISSGRGGKARIPTRSFSRSTPPEMAGSCRWRPQPMRETEAIRGAIPLREDAINPARTIAAVLQEKNQEFACEEVPI